VERKYAAAQIGPGARKAHPRAADCRRWIPSGITTFTKNHLPSYEQSKGIKKVTDHYDKEVNKQLKERDKRIRNLEEEVDIIKNPCASLCNHCDEVRIHRNIPFGVSSDEDVQGPESI